MKYCSQIYYYLVDNSRKIINCFYIKKQEQIEEAQPRQHQHKYCKMCDLDDFTIEVEQTIDNK